MFVFPVNVFSVLPQRRSALLLNSARFLVCPNNDNHTLRYSLCISIQTPYQSFFPPGKTYLHPQDHRLATRRDGYLPSSHWSSKKLRPPPHVSHLAGTQQIRACLRLRALQRQDLHDLSLRLILHPYGRVFHRRPRRHNFPHQQIQTEPEIARRDDRIGKTRRVQQGR